MLFAYKIHPDYDFIFLGNRDEFKDRPTKFSHFWNEHPRVLAGMDLLKGGTWTGITKDGRIAFITNYRDFTINRTPYYSRGYLVKDFLINLTPPNEYLKKVKSNEKKYDFFNLVVGTIDDLHYYSNVENKIRQLSPGIYGLSNALLDTPWPKVQKAKNKLSFVIREDFKVQHLFDILNDTAIPTDDKLPDTGLPLEKERVLSPIHIDSPDYGTRIKTVILVDKNRKVQFYEKALKNKQWKLSNFSFTITET
ncbi:NRDE family protein [Proteinivorax tanatarense]|uniref:NRDE family protein n=1 Tax=Proteinivorax tanatarense TaxID=1260629 RepID=A0AAU7VNC5_9FIRM